MKRNQRPPGSDEALENLRLELEDGLASDPRVLLDPGFLRILHRELRQRLGDAAEGVLLRAGFFHGLRDALRTAQAGDALVRGERGTGPLLAMQLGQPQRAADGMAVTGCWAEPLEARALGAAGIVPGEPACLLSSGYTSGWLSGLWETDVLALEEGCQACGAPRCRFVAREVDEWRAAADPRARRLIEQLPFDALWAVAHRSLGGEESNAEFGALDPESPAVHVWGPVMIVPYAGAETAVAVESVVRDPGARQVSVVVLDLAGVILDDSFGAVSLERALDAIEASGAETILAGVSPLSERVVAELERTHLLLRKDLSEAIAAAFQVAASQRNPA